MPPLNWLSAFEASARLLSFTAAAEELHMTQSAVSQQIKSLETALGSPLFLRRARGLELTDDGRRYLPTVQAAFATLESGTSALSGQTDTARLDVHCNLAFSIFWLSPRLEAFLDAHPWVRLNVVTSIWSTERISLSSSVEIRFGRGQWESKAGERLTRDTLFPVAAPALAERLREPDDLLSVRLLDVAGLIDGWPQWFRANPQANLGATVPAALPQHWASTYAVTLNWAREGFGVALAHETIAADLLAKGALTRPFDFALPMKEAYYLIPPPESAASPAARAFTDWMRAAAGI